MPTLLIDTDTASDDAVALIMALKYSSADVVAITTVSGNCPVAQSTKNALYVAELCGKSVPVYPGADRPLLQPAAHADWFHGKDGLGNYNYPAAKRPPEKTHAVAAIIAAAHAHPDLTLVTLGPLTNIALALAQDPSIAQKIKRCVIMGGAACTEGNVTPAAEYNIWCDPEAARIVFRCGLAIEMVGWELCRGAAALSAADIQKTLALNTPLARFAIECNSVAQAAYHTQTGEVGISLPDPVAMAVALDPQSIIQSSSHHYVEIETASPLTRGMTVVDRLNVSADSRNAAAWSTATRGPKALCIWSIHIPRWKALLHRCLSAA